MADQTIADVVAHRRSDELISVPAAANVSDAVAVMAEREVGAVLVMTRDVRFVSPGTTTEAALALMHVQGFRHLLVIDGARVYGLVSMRDLVYQIVRRGEGRFEAAVRAAAEPKP